jgi:hypothetical protein
MRTSEQAKLSITNKRRVIRAAVALYLKWDCVEEAATDLLADIMLRLAHRVPEFAQEMQTIADRALTHFNAERYGENTD